METLFVVAYMGVLFAICIFLYICMIFYAPLFAIVVVATPLVMKYALGLDDDSVCMWSAGITCLCIFLLPCFVPFI